MARKFIPKAQREFNILVDSVYAKWDDPRKTRQAVEKRLLRDSADPDKMALWEIAASSKKWSIEFPD